MAFKKIVGKIHLWLGLSSGLVVFILGITGCIYVFIDEISDMVYHKNLYVQHVGEKQLSANTLFLTAQKKLGENKPITRAYFQNDDQSTVQFVAYKESPQNDGIWFWENEDYHNTLYVNPYTAEIVKFENSQLEFFNIVLWLHWSLLLKNDIGQPIVGIAVIIFVILLITGLVLWWPKNKKATGQRLWLQWKKNTRWRRKNYDLHNIAGFYMMIFALLIAITGLMWAFDWFDGGVQWLANGGKTIPKQEQKFVSDVAEYTNQKPLNYVLEQMKQMHPYAKSYRISFPEDSTATLNAYIHYPVRTQDALMKFDKYTGRQLYLNTWKDKNNGEKVRAYNYDIHVGSVLGLPGKILAFIASLVSACLPVTGFIIWYGKTKKSKSKSKSAGKARKALLVENL